MLRFVLLALAIVVAATWWTAFRDGNDDETTQMPRDRGTSTTERPRKPAAEVRRARCPTGSANCSAATGRVIYVESVDDDGDGDLHLVVAGGSVTGPGISVLDISRDLRPRRDPRIGDTASAAGPVYRGSFGQRQIQATVLYVARR